MLYLRSCYLVGGGVRRTYINQFINNPKNGILKMQATWNKLDGKMHTNILMTKTVM